MVPILPLPRAACPTWRHPASVICAPQAGGQARKPLSVSTPGGLLSACASFPPRERLTAGWPWCRAALDHTWLCAHRTSSDTRVSRASGFLVHMTRSALTSWDLFGVQSGRACRTRLAQSGTGGGDCEHINASPNEPNGPRRPACPRAGLVLAPARRGDQPTLVCPAFPVLAGKSHSQGPGQPKEAGWAPGSPAPWRHMETSTPVGVAHVIVSGKIPGSDEPDRRARVKCCAVKPQIDVFSNLNFPFREMRR